MNLQKRIIRRHRLKRDISMPPITRQTTPLQQRIRGRRSSFLLTHAADDADLVAKLAIGFGYGVDVEAGGGGLMGC